MALWIAALARSSRSLSADFMLDIWPVQRPTITSLKLGEMTLKTTFEVSGLRRRGFGKVRFKGALATYSAKGLNLIFEGTLRYGKIERSSLYVCTQRAPAASL